MEKWRRDMGRWLNRLRFKSIHRSFMNDDMTYGEYKDRLFILVNDIRQAMDDTPYSYEKYDEAWQYRNLAVEDYKVAFDEMINVIFGWW